MSQGSGPAPMLESLQTYHLKRSFSIGDGARRGANSRETLELGRRTMRTWLIIGALLVGVPAVAQETRGTISGTVRDAQGVVPGAVIKITNVATNVVQPLVTNTSGYFEAPLLIAGEYQVNVEMAGFKTLS